MSKRNSIGVREKKLWLQRRQKLECSKPKYLNSKMMANCKNYIKGYRYDTYKALKNYSLSNYSKIQKCNLYAYQEKICQYIIK